MTKILIVGDFTSEIHEKALFEAFKVLGCDVYKFSWGQYFNAHLFNPQKKLLSDVSYFWRRLQNKFRTGPTLIRLNRDLINYANIIKPDFIFVYRGVVIFPKTIAKLKKADLTVFGYNNDDPFSKKYPSYFWRHFRKSIPYYDHIFVYRNKNIDDYKNMGYERTSLLRSYYIAERNFALNSLPTDKYKCDVIFVGHYEDDGRDEYLKKIIDAGINFKLYGPEWHRSKYYQFFKTYFKRDVFPLLAEEYNIAINSAKIDLVFFSSLNNDTYTRRVFEIVAAKKFMLSQRTEDMKSLFKEGKEADYFSNIEELSDKIRYYLENGKEREVIAIEGYERLIRDGHEVTDRAKEVLRVFEETIHKNE